MVDIVLMIVWALALILSAMLLKSVVPHKDGVDDDSLVSIEIRSQALASSLQRHAKETNKVCNELKNVAAANHLVDSIKYALQGHD